MDKDQIEDKLYQIIDQSNQKKIKPTNSLIFLNEIHSFYDGNGRTFKIIKQTY